MRAQDSSKTAAGLKDDAEGKPRTTGLRLAAAQCGMPMAFRKVMLVTFLKAEPQEKGRKVVSGKAKPFRTVRRQAAIGP